MKLTDFNKLKTKDFQNGAVIDEIRKVFKALDVYHYHNRLRNDLDVYLHAMGEWGFGEETSKPKKEDYGMIIHKPI